jgi:hypothetical protein
MSRVPKYCRHRGRNLAYVRINGQPLYLGRWQSDESRREYDRIVAELLSGRGKSAGHDNHDLTVAELLDQFRQYAEGYYRLPDSSHSSELSYLQSACRPLLRLYGHTLARSFGPPGSERQAYDSHRSRIYLPTTSTPLRITSPDLRRDAHTTIPQLATIPPVGA